MDDSLGGALVDAEAYLLPRQSQEQEHVPRIIGGGFSSDAIGGGVIIGDCDASSVLNP